MPNALKLLQNSPTFQPGTMVLGVTITGNYPTGGDPCDLTVSKIADPNAMGLVGGNVLPTTPPRIDVANGGGYYAQWIPGTTVANGKIMWFAPGGAQVAAGAYPAAVTGATVTLYAPIAG